MNPKTTFDAIDSVLSTELTSGGLVSREDLEALAGDGLTYNTQDEQLDVTNPFDPDGNYENLRAQSTTKADVGLANVTDDAQVKRSEMGVADGVATLDENARVPVEQLPLESVVFRGTFGSAQSTTEGDLPDQDQETGDLYIADIDFTSTEAGGILFRSGDKAIWDGNA